MFCRINPNVQKGDTAMTKITRLFLRNHTYYIRVALPRWGWDLLKKKEIRYSLNTKNYYDALIRLRTESYKIDIYIDFLKWLKMQIENGFVKLTNEELDKILIYRLRVIDDFIDKNYIEIRNHNISYDDISLFSRKNREMYNKVSDFNLPDGMTPPPDTDFTHYVFYKLFYDYLNWIGDRKDTTLSVNRIIDDIKNMNRNSQTPPQVENFNGEPKQLDFYEKLQEIEEMTKRVFLMTRHTGGGIYPTADRRIRRLLDVMQEQKRRDLTDPISTNTKWETVYNDMIRPAKHSKNVSSSHLKTKYQCLETIFELIDKPYVEQLNFDDIKKVNKLIYLVPKKWKERNPNKRLLDVLLPENDDSDKAISATSITKYLTIFQEFLKFCRIQKLIDADMCDILVKPKINKHKNVWLPFDSDDLKKIFNPKTYFRRTRDGDNHKYWLPLISLYSGCRLNEACQLRVCDFFTEKGIDYFSIKDDGEKQSVKTFLSTRRVPIHPVLKQLGLLEQVKFAKKQHQDRVFFSLSYSVKNHYASSMSNAFRYYLDTKLGMKDPRKVFHSFRHTVRTKFINCGVSEEDVNLICGWDGKGAGSQNYLHRDMVDIKKLYKAVCKLKYPEVERMLF